MLLVLLRLLPACAALLFALAGAPARGQAQAESSSHKAQEHKRILQEAMAEYERSNFAEARALFEAAHELMPTARTLRAIGMCAFEEKSYVLAVQYLSQALTDTRKPLTAEQRKQAEDALWRAREFVAKYRLELTPGDASVQIDGHAPLLEDGKMLLDAGNHRLSVSAAGYQPYEQTVSVRARETGEFVVTLVAEGATPAVASAALTASAASAPQPAASTQAGPPADAGGKGKLTKGQWVGVGLLGLGAVGLGLGIGYGIDAKNKHERSDCESTCPTEEDKALNDKAFTSGNVSTAMFAIGGAAAATGIFLMVWAREKKPGAHALRFSPVLAQGIVGGSARGTW